MSVVTDQKIDIDASSIYAMRYSGATLQQIADRIGRSKERVRQILIKNFGSTKNRLISTRKLCELSGLTANRIMHLLEDNVISPVKEWDTSTGRYYVWSHTTIERIEAYLASASSRRLCKICHRPVPPSRHCYCSEKCYKESHKYKYRSLESRRRHLANMKVYKQARKQLVSAAD